MQYTARVDRLQGNGCHVAIPTPVDCWTCPENNYVAVIVYNFFFIQFKSFIYIALPVDCSFLEGNSLAARIAVNR